MNIVYDPLYRLKMLMMLFLVVTIMIVITIQSASAQTTTGTVVHGGQILSDLVAWGAAAFGTAIASLLVVLINKASTKLGVETTQQQRDQLQSIIQNGLNSAAAKAQSSLGENAALDLNVKNQIVADAVKYTQDHGSETMKALGLDAQSGAAVQVIRARMATVVADPGKPTDPVADAAVKGAST